MGGLIWELEGDFIQGGLKSELEGAYILGGCDSCRGGESVFHEE